MENTLFFGNSFNRLSKRNISWNAILDVIKSTNKFPDDKLPNTMIYERILLQREVSNIEFLNREYKIKEKISDELRVIAPHVIYKDVYNMDFQNYITTNYDYAFTRSLDPETDYLSKKDEISSEDLYSIRRLKEIKNVKQKKKNFWQIHGEINKPATIMLGLDHYCGYIGKIDSYLKGHYKYYKDKKEEQESSIENKLKESSFKDSSWIDLFFNSNIHIVGFTLDFSEVDLWWIINRRARMKKTISLSSLVKNQIHFYCNEIEAQKRELLESFDVKVHYRPVENNDYLNYYNHLLGEIQKSLISDRVMV